MSVVKVGRFTVTKLNDSVLSDVSVKTKNSVEKEENEVLVQFGKDDKKNVKPSGGVVVNLAKDTADVLNPQVNFMQYNGLVATHQQFLMDYLEKDSKRQEMIEKIIKEILELTDKNAKLEIENNELKEILSDGKGNLAQLN